MVHLRGQEELSAIGRDARCEQNACEHGTALPIRPCKVAVELHICSVEQQVATLARISDSIAADHSACTRPYAVQHCCLNMHALRDERFQPKEFATVRTTHRTAMHPPHLEQQCRRNIQVGAAHLEGDPPAGAPCCRCAARAARHTAAPAQPRLPAPGRATPEPPAALSPQRPLGKPRPASARAPPDGPARRQGSGRCAAALWAAHGGGHRERIAARPPRMRFA